MLHQIEASQKRWAGHHLPLDHWLQERQDMLITYCELAGLAPFNHCASHNHITQLNRFCQLLIDYISAGHFELFSQISAKTPCEVADKLIEQVNKSTDCALKFNDKYSHEKAFDERPDIEKELSRLGEVLEERFKYEDQLIGYFLK